MVRVIKRKQNNTLTSCEALGLRSLGQPGRSTSLDNLAKEGFFLLAMSSLFGWIMEELEEVIAHRPRLFPLPVLSSLAMSSQA